MTCAARGGHTARFGWLRGRAAPAVLVLALVGCGGEETREAPAPAARAPIPCQPEAFRAALAREAGGPVRVTRLRCAGALALTRAEVGETRPLTLWRRTRAGWRREADGSPDRCRELVGADHAIRLARIGGATPLMPDPARSARPQRRAPT